MPLNNKKCCLKSQINNLHQPRQKHLHKHLLSEEIHFQLTNTYFPCMQNEIVYQTRDKNIILCLDLSDLALIMRYVDASKINAFHVINIFWFFFFNNLSYQCDTMWWTHLRVMTLFLISLHALAKISINNYLLEIFAT